MKEEITVALAGLGGYGHFYLNALLPQSKQPGLRLVAGIDPVPANCPYLTEIEAAGVPIYPGLTDFYEVGHADLVVVAAPIHLHWPLTQQALAHGSHVLCEKPLCATFQETQQFIAAQQAADRIVAVGYQWSFAEAILDLKADIQAGRLGQPIRLKSYVFWPRGTTYYGRNRWAGRIKTEDGQWVLDSPVNNATAHYLHNMFFVLGDRPETTAMPVSVQAELYRANPIQNYDTAALRSTTEDGVEILFYTAHPVSDNIGPVFEYEFEEAVVRYADRGARIIATYRDGRRHDYGDPFADDRRKLWLTADAIRNGGQVVCQPQTAVAQVLAMNGVQESKPDIIDYPPELLRTTGEITWVEGLLGDLKICYDRYLLPAEAGDISWASAGKLIDLQAYSTFPQTARLNAQS